MLNWLSACGNIISLDLRLNPGYTSSKLHGVLVGRLLANIKELRRNSKHSFKVAVEKKLISEELMMAKINDLEEEETEKNKSRHEHSSETKRGNRGSSERRRLKKVEIRIFNRFLEVRRSSKHRRKQRKHH